MLLQLTNDFLRMNLTKIKTKKVLEKLRHNRDFHIVLGT